MFSVCCVSVISSLWNMHHTLTDASASQDSVAPSSRHAVSTVEPYRVGKAPTALYRSTTGGEAREWESLTMTLLSSQYSI